MTVVVVSFAGCPLLCKKREHNTFADGKTKIMFGANVWPAETLALVVTLAALAVGYVWSKFRRIPMISGIAAIYGSRFWGNAHLFFPIDGTTDSQQKVKELVSTKGKIFQFYVFNNLFVLVNNGKQAKLIFDCIKNKGVRRGREFMEKNILSLETNDEWKRRRNQFRHAFTTAGLRIQEQLFRSLVSKFLNKLNQDCASQPTIPIDQLFGQFALNSIFTIGFEMEIDLLNNIHQFNELNGAIQSFFKVATIIVLIILLILLI